MFNKHLIPDRNKVLSNEKLSSPTPTPSQSKNSFIRPIPSVSCTSAFSVQSFHTAIGNYDDDDDDDEEEQNFNKSHNNLPTSTDQEESSSSRPPNTLFPTQSSYYKYQRQPKILSTSSSNTDMCNYLGPPTNSMMIHPMSLVNSHTSSSIPSNFYYYGSLDSGMLSKSPAGSYFGDYYNEDYEVVLDDGTRQKRSVSLSTMPISTPIEHNKKKYKANYNHLYYQNSEDDFNMQNKISQSQASE